MAGIAVATALVIGSAESAATAGPPASPPGPDPLAAASTKWAGGRVHLGAGDPVTAARRFLTHHPNRYDARSTDLVLAGTTVQQGITVTRFNQLYQGIPVLGGQYVVRTDDRGPGTTVLGTGGSFYPHLRVRMHQVSTARALTVAGIAVGRTVEAARLRLDGQVVLPIGRGVLTRQVTATGVDGATGYPVRREIFVGADSASPLLSYDSLDRDTAVSTTGHGFHSDTLPLDLEQRGTGNHPSFVFRDTTHGAPIETYDANGADVGPYAAGRGAAGLPLVSSDTAPVPASVNKYGALDAHWGAAQVYDFYKTVLGRNSLDGRGGAIRSVVGITAGGQPYPNAAWNGRIMVYGSGGHGFKPFAASLDVVGHEMTHGVVQYTAGLLPFGQPGAINEALADYFGNSVENRALGIADDSPEAALLGQDLCLNKAPAKCAIRDLSKLNTTKQYDTAGDDNGGVHQNSTIISGALWATRAIVGDEQSEKLVYTMLTQYLGPSATFTDVRAGALLAAKQLGVSSAQRARIADEFTKRGVRPGWERRDLGIDSTTLRPSVTYGTLAAAGNRYVVVDGGPSGDEYPAIYTGVVGHLGQAKISPSPNMSYQTPATDGVSAVWSAQPAQASGKQLIQTRSLRGGALHTLARLTASWVVSRTAISGGTVAWTVDNGRHDLVFAKAAGRPVVKVTPPAGRLATDATVRGNQVVYIDRPLVNRYGRTWQRLMVYNLATHRSRVLYAAKAILSTPVVTRRFVVFQADAHRDAGRSAVLRLNRDGTGLRTLVPEQSAHSPAFGRLAANDVAVTYSTFDGARLWQVPLTGGRAARVSCSRGTQDEPAMARGRRVIWTDSTAGATDLVSRARPHGICDAH